MILHGDCRDVLPKLAENSVNCVVTSPPYFGLRSYLPAGHPDKAREIGAETLHDCLGWATGQTCGGCFVCTMVDVFRHVRRVLRDDGVLWLNLGDSYAGSGRGGNTGNDSSTLEGGRSTQEESAKTRQRGSRLPAGYHKEHVEHDALGRAWVPPPVGLKQKDLCGIPYRVALALQADGWWWRDTVIWRKPNPMPSSVEDRCTPSYEPVLMLTKSARYWFDWQAIATPLSEASIDRLGQDVESQEGSHRANAGGKTNGTMKALQSRGPRMGGAKYGDDEREESRTKSGEEWTGESGLARRRNVWDIPTQGYKDAHFATFPERLPELCILATCPVGGTVLDPFLGSGTTGQVAQRLAREWIGIELNDGYLPLAKARAHDEQPGLPLGAIA